MYVSFNVKDVCACVIIMFYHVYAMFVSYIVNKVDCFANEDKLFVVCPSTTSSTLVRSIAVARDTKTR